MIRKLVFAAGVVAALTACGDNFAAVQKEDTIEAYEAFLEANPDSRWTMQANARLEDLYLQKARDEKSLEAYDGYLERFPEGALRQKALGEREEFLFDWAKGEGTQEAYERYLKEYPKGDKKMRKQAERMMAVYAYLPNVTLSEVKITQVNMAEDPKGPLDGWGFAVDVTNNGDKAIEDMRLRIKYLSPEGGALREKEWPVVAKDFGIPMEEEKKVPIQPGETRTWFWTDGVIPESWMEKKGTRIDVTRITTGDPA